MRKILLTGGMGYIGSHAAVSLIEKGYKVVIFDNLSNSKLETLDAIKKITGVMPEFIKGDINLPSNLDRVFKNHDIDIVIHFAGLKAVGESMEKPLEYFQTNLSGTINLLNLMKVYGIKKIVFSSSATVYGKPKYLPLDEIHTTFPENPYGESKLYAENIIKRYTETDPEFSGVILRYFNPVGAHESGLIGENPIDIPNNLMPYVVKVVYGKFEHLNVFGNDYSTIDGTGVRDYIHVIDLVEGHESALNLCFKENGFHIFNLGTGKGSSVLSIVETCERISKKKIDLVFSARRLGDVAESYATANKAEKILNWKAKRNLNDMCESALNFGKNFL